MAATMDWQGVTGQSWADEWRRTDRSFAALTEVLLARIAAEQGTRILDIGCGAGELSLAIAGARPGAEVLGVDISAQLVGAASGRAGGAARFALGDAATWDAQGFAPDLLVSRHGVMFFGDPAAAFAHLSRIAAPRARLVFSCFRAPALNGWASEIGKILANPGGPPRSPLPIRSGFALFWMQAGPTSPSSPSTSATSRGRGKTRSPTRRRSSPGSAPSPWRCARCPRPSARPWRTGCARCSSATAAASGSPFPPRRGS